jgi:hypothetical protein
MNMPRVWAKRGPSGTRPRPLPHGDAREIAVRKEIERLADRYAAARTPREAALIAIEMEQVSRQLEPERPRPKP